MFSVALGEYSSYDAVRGISFNPGLELLAIMLEYRSRGEHRLELHEGVLVSLSPDKPDPCLSQVGHRFYKDSIVPSESSVEVTES